MKHAGPLALFAALTAAWTWPLARHLTDAIPGDPGDNFLFLWNLWWMRHVLATPGLEYFRTTYLFFPFGTNLVNASQTMLPAFVAATVLGRVSVITAQNVLLLLYVWANMAAAYALAWAVTRHRRGAVLAGVVFGLSPYLAMRLTGHYELMAAWVLPAFALCLIRAVRASSRRAAVAAGLVLTAGAYTVYYYMIYGLLFAAVYPLAWSGVLVVRWAPHTRTPWLRGLRYACAGGGVLLAAAALFITITGGERVALGPIAISATTPQNALSGVWLFAIGWLLCTWRPAVSLSAEGLIRARRALAPLAVAAFVFAAGISPLAWQTVRLIRHGEYVSPEYQWRSAPHGVDLLSPLMGHPRQWLLQSVSRRAYAAAHLDVMEAIGWMGIVPLLILLCARPRADAREDERIWRLVAAAFGIWALGPFLTVAGHDTGLRLPAILLRYVPIVANARMPGRAIVGVFMALGVLLAMRLSGATGKLRPAAAQWLVIALVAFEYLDAPIPLTRMDAPPIYRTLAQQPPGAVCEVPFGVADGLSSGVGVLDRRAVFYATLHEHPIAGGYVARMPEDADRRYEAMPIAGVLLRLSDGRPAGPAAAVPLDTSKSPCRYLVVNRELSSAALKSYIASLPADRIATDEHRDLYRLRD